MTYFILWKGTSPVTIVLLVIGFIVLVLAGFWEAYTNRSPIIPPRLFKVGTVIHHLESDINTAFCTRPVLQE